MVSLSEHLSKQRARVDRPAGPPWLLWFLPSLGVLIAGMALIRPLGPGARQLFATDGDVGRHIRVGSTILDSLSIPRVDLFSHTMRGQPFVPYEWLSEVLFAGAHAALGLAGVALLTALLFALTCYAVYWITLRLGVDRPLAALAAAYSLLLQSIHLLPRPHMFTSLLTAVWFGLLLEHRRGGNPAWVWPLPPLMLLWANLHGGFLVGFMLLGVFTAVAWLEAARDRTVGSRSRLKALAIVAAASLVLALANPAGVELFPHTIGYLGSGYMADRIEEYWSPDFHSFRGLVFLAGILLGILLAMSGRVRIRLLEGALFLLWLAAALHSERNVPLFMVVVVPLMARWMAEGLRNLSAEPQSPWGDLARSFTEWQRRVSAIDERCRPVVPVLVLAGVVVWAVAGSGSRRYAFAGDVFPVAALQSAQEGGVSGRVFNEFIWGGYLLYEAYPEYPVFVDGQADFYGERLLRKYATAMSASPGWERILEDYHVDWTLTMGEAPLNAALERTPGWRRFYRDSVATIFVRTQPGGVGAPISARESGT